MVLDPVMAFMVCFSEKYVLFRKPDLSLASHGAGLLCLWAADREAPGLDQEIRKIKRRYMHIRSATRFRRDSGQIMRDCFRSLHIPGSLISLILLYQRTGAFCCQCTNIFASNPRKLKDFSRFGMWEA